LHKQHETLLGYETGEIENRHASDWFMPETKEMVFTAVAEVMGKAVAKPAAKAKAPVKATAKISAKTTAKAIIKPAAQAKKYYQQAL
jgi:hypothetical protein